MKFFGNGKVWNPIRHELGFEFVNGEFETTDKELIELAKANGFESEGTAELPELELPEIELQKPKRSRK